jgi:hypothetical protein
MTENIINIQDYTDKLKSDINAAQRIANHLYQTLEIELLNRPEYLPKPGQPIKPYPGCGSISSSGIQNAMHVRNDPEACYFHLGNISYDEMCRLIGMAADMFSYIQHDTYFFMCEITTIRKIHGACFVTYRLSVVLDEDHDHM